jgi:hypothetical protein
MVTAAARYPLRNSAAFWPVYGDDRNQITPEAYEAILLGLLRRRHPRAKTA